VIQGHGDIVQEGSKTCNQVLFQWRSEEMPTQRFMQTWILAWITRTKHMQCDFGDFGPFFNTEKGLCTYHIGFFCFLFFSITRMQNSPKNGNTNANQ
jgi:hypothetical protein